MTNEIFDILDQYDCKLDYQNYKFIKSDETKIVEDTIYYKTVPQALLTLLTKQTPKNDVPKMGIMLDVSRGPVNTVENIKSQLVSLCTLGYEYIMLYMEDMMDIDVNRFGYLRGKYSGAEIKAIVEFATVLEIEVIPCIQTLGHYENFLRWDLTNEIKDTNSVLNPKSELALDLIRKTIEFCAQNFTSSKIHIGLDEAIDLGRGTFLKQYGYQPQAEIFYEHLKFVYNTCMELGYQDVIIWSDMLFTVDGTGGELYDNSFNSELAHKLLNLEGLKFCYWNYWSKTEKEHLRLIDQHLNIVPAERLICAGGVNQWGQLTYLLDSNISYTSLLAAMDMRNLNELLLTVWFDGAGFTNYYPTCYGIFERAMNLYQLDVDQQLFKQVFALDYNQVKMVCEFSKRHIDAPKLLWDNPLHLVYLKNAQISINDLKQEIITTPVDEKLAYSKTLINFTIEKTIFGLQCLNHEFDITRLKQLIELCDTLNSQFRSYWLTMYKFNGMGNVQGQFALLKNRFEELLFRVENNLPIPELEENEQVAVTESFNSVFYVTNYRH